MTKCDSMVLSFRTRSGEILKTGNGELVDVIAQAGVGLMVFPSFKDVFACGNNFFADNFEKKAENVL